MLVLSFMLVVFALASKWENTRTKNRRQSWRNFLGTHFDPGTSCTGNRGCVGCDRCTSMRNVIGGDKYLSGAALHDAKLLTHCRSRLCYFCKQSYRLCRQGCLPTGCKRSFQWTLCCSYTRSVFNSALLVTFRIGIESGQCREFCNTTAYPSYTRTCPNAGSHEANARHKMEFDQVKTWQDTTISWNNAPMRIKPSPAGFVSYAALAVDFDIPERAANAVSARAIAPTRMCANFLAVVLTHAECSTSAIGLLAAGIKRNMQSYQTSFIESSSSPLMGSFLPGVIPDLGGVSLAGAPILSGVRFITFLFDVALAGSLWFVVSTTGGIRCVCENSDHSHVSRTGLQPITAPETNGAIVVFTRLVSNAEEGFQGQRHENLST